MRESHPASDGSPKSMAVSPDGKLVVIGASDGVVRVWDAGVGHGRARVQGEPAGPGRGSDGNDRIVIGLQDGTVLIMSLDPQELLQATRGSLARGFTPEECERFNFGDQCPTLDQLRGGPP